MYSVLKNLAQRYNVGIDAIVLQFCSKTIPKSIILSGASNSEQLKENLKMNSFSLSDSDLEMLHSFAIKPEFYWSERKQLQWN